MLVNEGQPASLGSRIRTWVPAVAIGTAYGVLLRGYVDFKDVLLRHLQPHNASANAAVQNYQRWSTHLVQASLVMTLAFLVLGPLVIGYLTVSRIEAQQRSSVVVWIFAPWLAVLAMMAAFALFAWEGSICIVMALPITLVLGSVGGVAAGLLSRRRLVSSRQTICLAMLPFVLTPAEALVPAPTAIRTVHNQVTIHAGPDVIWRNIERVPAIAPAELRPTWAHRLGFPRPVEATLSYEGVGGVRHASFERGVLFLETVTAWEPKRRLAFQIRADSANIPPTTLDEHVTIGGRYFDVLDGEYRLEALPNGDTLLHLTSHQRLSTDFNGYASLWTRAVMSELQTSILEVIQHRCEHPSTTALTSR